MLRPRKNATRLILFDWTGKNDPTTPDYKSFLWEVALLSLLYDEVLIQDNILLSSKKLAEWFAPAHRFPLLEEFIDRGLLVVLKRPQREYPTDKLIEMAAKNPISARAQLMESSSTLSDGTRIIFNEQQSIFQKRLEACLEACRTGHRFAGETRDFDLMESFGNLLQEVLGKTEYTKWRQTIFPHITEYMAGEFAKYAESPEIAVERVRASGRDPATINTASGKLVLHTPLAMQAADLFEDEKARRDMQRLVATTFAAPFSWGEKSNGAYGRRTRELVLLPEHFSEEQHAGRLVKPNVITQIPLSFPQPTLGFGRIVQEIRESKAGKALRRSMPALGKQLSFDQQEQRWRAVAEELNRRLVGPTGTQLTLASVCAHIGQHLFLDILVHVPWWSETTPSSFLKDLLIGGSVPSLQIGGEYIYENLRVDLKAQRWGDELQKAVRFRCVDVPKLVNLKVRSISNESSHVT